MTTFEPTAVFVSAVSKSIRQRQILNNVNLKVATGEISGIYGPNGSGKSMLLRIISGLVLPDRGKVNVFGTEIRRETEFPSSLGALIDGPGFLLDRSGKYNLELLASIRNIITSRRIIDVLEMVGLDPNDNRPVRTYSTGMRQRLGVAQAIMEHPRLLLLDEPTSALDNEGSQQIVNLLKNMQSQGVTIVTVSHKSSEINSLCGKIYKMQDGNLIEDLVI